MANIHDVAREAKVSISSVTRAFRNYPDMNPQTRERILAVAEELNYQPNPAASRLASKRTNVIGLLVAGWLDDNEKNTFLNQIIKGAFSYAGEHELELVVYPLDFTEISDLTFEQFCAQRMLEGAIVLGLKSDDPFLLSISDSKIPCVVIDQAMEGGKVGFITTENFYCSRELVRGLIERGQQNFLIIKGTDAAFVTRERLRGYRAALEEAAVPEERIHVIDGNYSESRTIEVLNSYIDELGGSLPPTAIVAMSDLMALGAFKVLQERGFRIPEEVTLAGFDGNPLLEYTQPPITTVKQSIGKMGYEGASLLREIIEGAEGQERIVPAEIQWRESTGALPEALSHTLEDEG